MVHRSTAHVRVTVRRALSTYLVELTLACG